MLIDQICVVECARLTVTETNENITYLTGLVYKKYARNQARNLSLYDTAYSSVSNEGSSY